MPYLHSYTLFIYFGGIVMLRVILLWFSLFKKGVDLQGTCA
jgi:hypothetical protein